MGRRASMNAKKRNRRIITISVIVLIVAVAVGLGLVVAASNTSSPEIGKPVSSTILGYLTGVSDSTLSTIGKPSGVVAPTAISGTALTSGGKPEILYVGGDYCPYCAMERWSLIVALSQFGTFSNLLYMQSSSSDVNPNSPTFTFSNATYTSQYITFVGVEEFTRSGSLLQNLTSAQNALITDYDKCTSSGQNGGIPFVDIANAYVVSCGAQSSLDLSGQTWTQVASVLNTPTSSTAQQIDGAANTLITAICNVLKNSNAAQPSACSQSYASVTLAYVTAPSPGGQVTLSLGPQLRLETRWTALPSHY